MGRSKLLQESADAVKDSFQKIIVTKSSMKPWIDDKGVLHTGLYDFLLKDDILN